MTAQDVITSVPVADGALSTRAHLFVVVVSLATIVWMIQMVRKRKLRTKYSLLWVFVAIILATVAVFPGLLERLSHAAGVYYPPATLLFMAVGFLFVVVVHFSWEFSRSEERLRAMAEEFALLRAEHEKLERQVENQLLAERDLANKQALAETESGGSSGNDDEPIGRKGSTELGE